MKTGIRRVGIKQAIGIVAIITVSVLYSASSSAESYSAVIPDDKSLALNYKVYCVEGVKYMLASRSAFGTYGDDDTEQLVMSVMYSQTGKIATCKGPKHQMR